MLVFDCSSEASVEMYRVSECSSNINSETVINSSAKWQHPKTAASKPSTETVTTFLTAQNVATAPKDVYLQRKLSQHHRTRPS